VLVEVFVRMRRRRRRGRRRREWDGSQSFATFSQRYPAVEDHSPSILRIPYIQIRVEVQVGMGERFGSEKVEPGDEEAEVGM